MSRSKRHPLIAGTRVTGLGTLASRVLGMVRDMVTAWLLGAGGVMDAFVTAYRLPNLFRRLFGEGALTASYLPVFSAHLEADRKTAWQLASVTLTWVAVLLSLLVLAGEGLCGLIWLVWGDVPGVGLLIGLAAIMLPYMMLICLAAQVSATLHALSHFSVPALTGVLMNVCWLAAAWLVAPKFTDSQQAQAYVLAVAILLAGLLQVGVQLPVLHRLGFRFDYNWSAGRAGLGQIVTAMAPTLVGLAVTQINTLVDSLIAWGLAVRGDDVPIPWLGGAVCYPLREGAAAAIYYGERLYHFPLGVLGLAVATAIFPLLARHAARGDHAKLGADLTFGLRLVVSLGVPAGVGLILLAEPLARLLFQRGEFTADDTIRTAHMIRCYATGVWAFCALPVVVRGFYALGDCGTPAKTAGWIVGLNLTLNLLLLWPMAEAGLAVATSVSAGVQVLLLMFIFSRRKSALLWRVLAVTLARTVLATAAMAVVAYQVLVRMPPGDGLWENLVCVFVVLGVSVAVYCGVYWLLGGRELGILLGHVPLEDDE